MLITCEHCNRQMTLPDEKVPERAFALTCPGCGGRVEVDPTGSAAASEAFGFEPLPPLREFEKSLVERVYPLAVLANLTSASVDHLESALKLIGMEEVQKFTDLEEAVLTLQESEVGIAMIVLDKATAPPCEPLEPMTKIPSEIRRHTFVALVASNVRSLDGQTAFYLQMNCLLNANEVTKIPTHIQRALVFHLRHYRYWGAED